MLCLYKFNYCYKVKLVLDTMKTFSSIKQLCISLAGKMYCMLVHFWSCIILFKKAYICSAYIFKAFLFFVQKIFEASILFKNCRKILHSVYQKCLFDGNFRGIHVYRISQSGADSIFCPNSSIFALGAEQTRGYIQDRDSYAPSGPPHTCNINFKQFLIRGNFLFTRGK